MKKILVFGMLALAMPFPLIAGSASAATKPKPKPTAAVGIHQAQAAALLTKSLNAMKALHSFHADGTETGNAAFDPSATAQLAVFGVCAGKIPQPWLGSYQGGYFKTLTTIGGRLTSKGKTTILSSHYIRIAKAASAKVWERSPLTNNRWQLERVAPGPGQSTEVLMGNSVTSFMCEPLYLPHQDIRSIVKTFTTPRFSTLSDLGASTINGANAEHLQAAEKIGVDKVTYDFFVAQGSNYWVRFGTTVRSTSKKLAPQRLTTRTYTYSQFNQRVSIVAPKVGASTP